MAAVRPVRSGLLLALLIAACAGALVLAFFVGSSGMSFEAFRELLAGRAPAGVEGIFFQIRLPRALGALFVGASLSVSGCALQSVFRNPMADPYVLGISAGAGLGAAAAISLASAGDVLLTAALSFVGALGTMLLVYRTAHVRGRVTTFSLLLSGFVISALMSALLSLLMILNRDKIEQVVLWNMGSLSAMTWPKLWVLMPASVACILLLWFQSRSLNVLLTGTESAETMGIDTRSCTRRVLAAASLLTATAVSTSGIIGFVGLMVPHLLRMASGPDNRVLIPLCGFGGGAYLLLCDTGARTLAAGQELPVGILTAILGVPFFIYLLRKGRGPGGI